VQEFNSTVRQFPTNLTAMIFHMNVKPNFTVADEGAVSAPPKVDFGKGAAPAVPNVVPPPANAPAPSPGTAPSGTTPAPSPGAAPAPAPAPKS